VAWEKTVVSVIVLEKGKGRCVEGVVHGHHHQMYFFTILNFLTML
jgi:hypothetical protein